LVSFSETLFHDGVYYGAQEAGDCESELRVPVTISLTGFPAPSAPSPQTICDAHLHTLADLTITGIGIKWYDASFEGNELPETTPVVSGASYYASQSSVDCEGASRVRIDVTSECYNIHGTVFPFVYTGDSIFDSQFLTVAQLYMAPPASILDKIGYLRKQTPLRAMAVTYYDCAVDAPILGAPKNPGIVGRTDNPGLSNRWSTIGIDFPGEPNAAIISSADKCPTSHLGKFTFENLAPGRYVIELSRQGFMPRYGVINVTNDHYIGHRELLGGDVNGDLVINEKDLSAIRTRMAPYGHSQYNAMYDFQGTRNVTTGDMNVIRINLGAYTTIYLETFNFVNNL
jgi:hypothetical protein